MFDRGRPKDSAPSSPDKKTAPSQGSHMNSEQFGSSHHFDSTPADLPCRASPSLTSICPPLQLRTSEIFATIVSRGPVVRGHSPLAQAGRTPFASRLTAALHWVQLLVHPLARLLDLLQEPHPPCPSHLQLFRNPTLLPKLTTGTSLPGPALHPVCHPDTRPRADRAGTTTLTSQ